MSGILTHPASFGPMVPDLQVLENLKELDRAIHQGRHFVNFQFIVAETQPVGTGWIGREIHQLFRFLKQAERDQDNIYVCYCRRPGRC